MVVVKTLVGAWGLKKHDGETSVGEKVRGLGPLGITHKIGKSIIGKGLIVYVP